IAAAMLSEQGYKVNIISFNRTSFQEEGDIENPIGNDGINDLIDIRTIGDPAYKYVRGGGATNEYIGPGQKLLITSEEEGLGKHKTANADLSQIENAGLEKLKPVPSEFTPAGEGPIGPLQEDGSF